MHFFPYDYKMRLTHIHKRYLRAIFVVVITFSVISTVIIDASIRPQNAVYATPTTVYFHRLHASGTELVNELGQHVILRGASRITGEFNCGDYQTNDFALMHQEGFNAVRLTIAAGLWLHGGTPINQPCTSTQYQSIMTNKLEDAEKNGIIPILVMQGGSLTGGSVDLHPQGVYQYIYDAWNSIISTPAIEDDPSIMFTLIGEPSDLPTSFCNGSGSTACDTAFWKNGGTGDNGKTYCGYQQLVDMINTKDAATGLHHMIFVPTKHYDQKLDFINNGAAGSNSSTGSNPCTSSDPNCIYSPYANIGYEVHYYPSATNNVTDTSFLQNELAGITFAPVIAGEYGVENGCFNLNGGNDSCNSAQTQRELDYVSSYFETNATHGQTGYFAWGWEYNNGGSFFDTSQRNLPNPQPTTYGQYVIAAVSGQQTAAPYVYQSTDATAPITPPTNPPTSTSGGGQPSQPTSPPHTSTSQTSTTNSKSSPSSSSQTTATQQQVHSGTPASPDSAQIHVKTIASQHAAILDGLYIVGLLSIIGLVATSFHEVIRHVTERILQIHHYLPPREGPKVTVG